MRAGSRPRSRRRLDDVGDGPLAVALALLVAAALLTACGSAAPPGTVSVTGDGVTATVRFDPFGLSVETAAGRAALSEVTGRGVRPTTQPPAADPVTPGVEPATGVGLAAPLAFLVGTVRVAQHRTRTWAGDLRQGSWSGTWYSATSVTAEHADGAGLELTVATDDPSGRTLHVVVVPEHGGLVHVAVTPHPSAGVAVMSDAFRSPPHEAFYGFGGRHDALDQRGKVVDDWVAEENVPGLGHPGKPTGVLYPNGPTAAYDPQAELISSAGYGFLLEQPELSWFRLDPGRSHAWSVAVDARRLDYDVAPGAAKRAIGAVTSVSGRQPVPAAWELGPMLDREVRNVGETVASYDAEMTQDLDHIRADHLPLTAYRIEGFGFGTTDDTGFVLPTRDTFDVQQHVVHELRAMHIHPLAYIRPWVAPGSLPAREGFTVQKATGAPYTITGTLGQKIALLDFTNPAAVHWWRKELDKIFNLGFDGFEQDFGEEVLGDMHFFDGETGSTMHNRYAVLYLKATREAVTSYERAHPGRQLWFDSRAGFSGTPGSAAFESADFPGDEATDWGHASGLASLTDDMLNRAVNGQFGYGTDIGGYSDYTTPPTTAQLFARWAEWAALSPVFRLHGSARAGLHTPWSYGPHIVAIYDAMSTLHEDAAPLITRLWRQADRTGVPPTRPLWLEVPGSSKAAGQTQEWTLGNDVLVAPVVTRGATSRSVYFPAGCWRDPTTGLAERGPSTATVPAPLATLPYFFRCGTRPFRS